MAEVTILKNTPRQAIVRAIGNGSFFCNLSSLLSTVKANSNVQYGSVLQTLDLPNASATITDIIYSVAGGTPLIQRGNGLSNANVFHIAGGDGDLRFSQEYGFVLSESANANIVINFNSAIGTIILGISKSAGFNEPNLQTLEPWQKP